MTFFVSLTYKCASRHNGVQFLIPLLNSYLRTRRCSEPTFRPCRDTFLSSDFASFLCFAAVAVRHAQNGRLPPALAVRNPQNGRLLGGRLGRLLLTVAVRFPQNGRLLRKTDGYCRKRDG